jgi:hypothetical protein
MAGTIEHSWNGTILTIKSDSGTSSCDLKGAKGDIGVRGPQGEPGLGIPGPQGIQGIQGIQGEKGKDGEPITIHEVIESGEHGGVNQVIFSDGNSLLVKNGTNGKSAYEYAKEGGYAGTEAEFAEDINPDNINQNAEDFIVSELAKRSQLKPEFANNIDECTDTTKLYVLPDGYIYAYMKKETVASGWSENLVPASKDTDGSVFNGTGYQDGKRLSSSGSIKDQDSSTLTGFIPCTKKDVVALTGVCFATTGTTGSDGVTPGNGMEGSHYSYLAIYNSSMTLLDCVQGDNTQLSSIGVDVTWGTYPVTSNTDIVKFDFSSYTKDMAYIRINGVGGSGANMIVTKYSENISTVITEGWYSTNHAFVSTDYENRIIDLEKSMEHYVKENKTLKEQVQDVEEQVEDIVNGVVDISSSMKFNHAAYGLPVLKLTGDTTGMSKDVKKTLAYEYGKLSGSCTLKWQGNSSLAYEKKNYTIVFDNAFEAKAGWGEQKKYCLKANFIDHSHARNIVCAKLWSQMVACRTIKDEKLNTSPNYGAIDGFPIVIELNGKFHGLYTFNIPKEDWMFGMGSGEKEAILCADIYGDAVAFKALANLQNDFELEYSSDDNSDWVLESLNRLIQAVMNSDGTNLDTTLAKYIDWDSAIDYYIYTVLIEGADNTKKNYLLATYDGTKWFYSAYDMDSTFGLYWDGKSFLPADNRPTFATRNSDKLMALIWNYKRQKLHDRCVEIMESVFSESNVAVEFSNFGAGLPKPLLEKDVELYPSIPSTAVNNTSQILNYYRMRFALATKWMEDAMVGYKGDK